VLSELDGAGIGHVESIVMDLLDRRIRERLSRSTRVPRVVSGSCEHCGHQDLIKVDGQMRCALCGEPL
jgi:hypothetical protein